MENEMVVLTEEMLDELKEALAALANGQVRLQRLVAALGAKAEQQDTKSAQQDSKIARLEAQVGVLTKLVEAHQANFEILKIHELGGGGPVQ